MERVLIANNKFDLYYDLDHVPFKVFASLTVIAKSKTNVSKNFGFSPSYIAKISVGPDQFNFKLSWCGRVIFLRILKTNEVFSKFNVKFLMSRCLFLS